MPQGARGASPYHSAGLPPTSPSHGATLSPSSSFTGQDESKKKKFHPLKAMRRMFRRKKYSRDETEINDNVSRKSRSTSELQQAENEECEVLSDRDGTGPYSTRLSMSHDSIFTSELDGHQTEPIHGSSLSIQGIAMRGFKDELFNRVRSRRDSDEDMGLPHSPSTFQSTADVIARGLKDKKNKSRSTWSDGSLISMGSSENDEDSMYSHMSSHHSSHASLLDRRSFTPDGDVDVTVPIPLRHDAAHHKIAIRPKKTHAAGRHRSSQHLVPSSNLPSTPEVEETTSTASISVRKKDEHQRVVAAVSASKDHIKNKIVSKTDVPNKLTATTPTDPSTNQSASRESTKMQASGSSKSPRTFPLKHDIPKSSPPVSRSKSSAAELKLQHEINQFSKRMADMPHGSENKRSPSPRAESKSKNKTKTDSKASTKEESSTSTTEELLKNAWLKEIQSNSGSDVDEYHNTKPKCSEKKAAALASPDESKEGGEHKDEPFFSRIFGSRKSGRKVKKKDDLKSPDSEYDSENSMHFNQNAKQTKSENKSFQDWRLDDLENISSKKESNSLQWKEYEREPCVTVKRSISEKEKKSAVKSSPSMGKDSNGVTENEFMLKFKKISENSEKRASIGKRSSGELIYQSHPCKDSDVTSLSRNVSKPRSSSDSIQDASDSLVQFRILPASDGPSSYSEEESSSADSGPSSLIFRDASLIDTNIQDSSKQKQLLKKNKSVVEITEMVDDNANITKISASKNKFVEETKLSKSPLRETQPDISNEKSAVGFKNLKLRPNKSTKKNSTEISVSTEKVKPKGSSPESELFKVFAKLSQKQDSDVNNDKENEGEINVAAVIEKTELITPPVCNEVVRKDSSSSNRPRSRTLPEVIPVTLQPSQIDAKVENNDVKRSNSQKKFFGVKQDSECGNSDSTPPWLVLAQQRREQREKREKHVFGDQNVSFVIENSVSKSNQRSSKVMDMVSSFQKLHVS